VRKSALTSHNFYPMKKISDRKATAFWWRISSLRKMAKDPRKWTASIYVEDEDTFSRNTFWSSPHFNAPLAKRRHALKSVPWGRQNQSHC